MNRIPLAAVCSLHLAPLALLPQLPVPNLKPITAPVRHAGIYHVATGTWTRGASESFVAGPDVIYDNDCASSYFFASQLTGEKWQHRARIPSPTGPTIPSPFIPGGYDATPGCSTSYTIQGFETGYCSSAQSTIDYGFDFADLYDACATGDMVPTRSFVITGLPGGTPGGAQRCWIIDIDLSAVSPPFVLQADGDGTFGAGTPDTFGFSLGPVSSVPPGSTGPIPAGDFYTCTGAGGTIWDQPINLSEQGTGMGSSDFFRITGPTSAPSGPGCYSFGASGEFVYLKIFSNTGCSGSPMATACFPGVAGTIGCPCGNPPSESGRGCDNFGQHTGGARLGATGDASIAADSVVITSTWENNTALTILTQGTTSSTSGLLFGAGVRCVGGTLKRLYTGAASAGTFSRPRPSDASVHVRSGQLGDPLAAGDTRYYFAYYRDPLAAVPCADPTRTFNASESGSIAWAP